MNWDELDSDSSMQAGPTLHLPHLLQVLGPLSLTLCEHMRCQRRIFVYTQPPVEPAYVPCQVAADMYQTRTQLL